ncbi:MAG: Smr/MutS family protein [Beijerinckiaceae bacterium]|nr:Smr/MutS family protein [Beijerinckiaceae bacterium]
MDAIKRKPASRRSLARHELELWVSVTRHVRPLFGKRNPIAPVSDQAAPPAPSPAQPPAAKIATREIKPLVPLEQETLRKLSRGSADPEARIDLHGMRQAEAHSQLKSFLHHRHAVGLRVVLVITGKGASADLAFRPDERGVLRRMVPHWLAAPDLRTIVLGFNVAARRHGGEGAFYVRLRASNSHRIHTQR